MEAAEEFVCTGTQVQLVPIERPILAEAESTGRAEALGSNFDVFPVMLLGGRLEEVEEFQKFFGVLYQWLAMIGERQRDEPATSKPAFDATEYRATDQLRRRWC